MKSVVGSYLPSQYGDVFGLLARTLRSGNPAARAAVGHTALGLVALPADLILQRFERRLETQGRLPVDPIVIVCGPPRSGTTLLSQVLMKHLPVTYFTNLTSVFPRSPITATRLFGRHPDRSRIETRSYYGKTRFFGGPNDALYLWDRWLGANRQALPGALTATQAAAMTSFFGAWQAVFPGPLVTKNNRLILLAGLVADAVPTARFLCLRREPIGLAASLLEARQAILGNMSRPYGAVGPEYFQAAEGCAPEMQACLQVRYYDDVIRRQQLALGPDRFRVVDYTDFCANPVAIVRELARQLPVEVRAQDLAGLQAFEHSGPRDGRGAIARSVIEGHCRDLGLLEDRGSAVAC